MTFQQKSLNYEEDVAVNNKKKTSHNPKFKGFHASKAPAIPRAGHNAAGHNEELESGGLMENRKSNFDSQTYYEESSSTSEENLDSDYLNETFEIGGRTTTPLNLLIHNDINIQKWQNDSRYHVINKIYVPNEKVQELKENEESAGIMYEYPSENVHVHFN